MLTGIAILCTGLGLKEWDVLFEFLFLVDLECFLVCFGA